ncbi:MAG: WXG100 family type VII secretion target [Demequina sp.]|uniref:WXG100 family type VII secretion target n=1 Tax=Demequina sp. TaxID=2050685 RepID=UPI003A8B6018
MSVRPEQVTELAGSIRTGATGIRTELDELDKKVATLKASWNGQAQASYDEAERQWNKSISDLQQLLAQIANKTDEISNSYVSTDNQAAKRFSI